MGVPAGLTYFLSILFTKLSILGFYLRFCQATALRATIYAVLFVTTGYSLVGAFGFTFICRPLAKMWDFSLPGRCLNAFAWWLVTAVLNAITDLVILLLPIWILKPLTVPLMQRVIICGILMAGGL
jgi:hypothetical protein